MPLADLECALSDMFFWDEMREREQATADSAYRCADGAVLDVAKQVTRVSTQPLRYAVCATSTAQHYKVASELTTMASRLRATLEATADGILLVDNAGAILNMNRRFSALWDVPDDLLQRRDDAGIMAHLQSQTVREEGDGDRVEPGAPDTGADDTFATQYLRNGKVLECSSHAARSGAELIGRVYYYRDVTERYRTQADLIAARDEAKRASQAKGDFLAMMSHEIRTPMNGVLGIAQLLAGTPLDDEQTAYLRVIRSSGETLLAILNDILDYSKIEAGKLELERTDFALAPLLEEITALFRFRLTETGPTFHCEADADVPARLRGDSVRLRQILFNLVGNAFKFTERGSITVTVRKHAAAPNMLRFAVRDTGIGIPADRQAGVFEAFVVPAASSAAQGGGSAAPATVLTSATRILLVEDNPVNCMVIGGMLQRLGGAKPVVAGNGEEALARMAEATFDVILMDSQMPVMDGLEATRRLRALGHTLPIIGLSAGALDEERQAALTAGASDYVLKPVDMPTLAAALARALGGPV